MKFSSRQWLIYFAAWIPYALSYVAVFAIQGSGDFAGAFYTTLLNIIPASITGVGIVFLCRRFDWKLHKRWYFFIAHLLFAIVYTFAWYGLVLLTLTIDLSARRGAWSPVWFTGYALQWQLFSGVMIYATVACIVYLLQISQNLRVEEQRAARAETRAAQAEALYAQSQLSALRAQLNPHFLFNTLHSLMALTRYEPQKAEIALEKLAEMLRYVLEEKRHSTPNLIPLKDEWQFIQNYLELEKMRLDERLNIVAEIESETLDCLLPAFTLQPLVENAVKHGISPRQNGGTITIKARKDADHLELKVSDNGGGALNENLTQSNGLGLKLVGEQLENTYGSQAELSIENVSGQGFAVKIKLPLK